MKKTVDFNNIVSPEKLATNIYEKWSDWNQRRSSALSRWAEICDYVFASDTRATSARSTPWQNSTTRPKLCQIFDNLSANYLASLFPSPKWLSWESENQDSASVDRREKIRGYILQKLKVDHFERTVKDLIVDWILYGNCFALVEYKNVVQTRPNGEYAIEYQGASLSRISPYDIMFDITASNFQDSPKIIRRVVSYGQLKQAISQYPEDAEMLKKAFAYQEEVRHSSYEASQQADFIKNDAFCRDGYSSWKEYVTSGKCELLDFYGSIFDEETGEFLDNYIITVMDRSRIIRKERIDSWQGCPPIRHCGWRTRPDNLLAMSPLENLIGMQYRIDHLENMKADVFDKIGKPKLIIQGELDRKPTGEPDEILYLPENTRAYYLAPDGTALNADLQIRELEEAMENYAGAPKQAMGIRTAGEKTAFEVQSLDNAASRMFQNKISMFERDFLEPIINDFLEVERSNMTSDVMVRTVDDVDGTEIFLEVTPEDITGKGRLTPIGARHFAYKANLVQNVTQVLSTIARDPAVATHISGLALAKLVESALDLQPYKIVRENVRVFEQADTQRLAQAAMQNVQEEGMIPTAEEQQLANMEREGII